MLINAFDPEAGEDIVHACSEACRIAASFDMNVWFDFNGVHMLARPDSKSSEMVHGYYGALNRKSGWTIQNPVIGDHPDRRQAGDRRRRIRRGK